MNALQQRCLLLSAGLHLLLGLVLLVGPAFVRQRSDTADLPVLRLIPANQIPARLTDERASGGGNPRAVAPPVQPQPAPRPPAVVTPPPATPPQPRAQPAIEEPRPAPAPRVTEPAPRPEPRAAERSTVQTRPATQNPSAPRRRTTVATELTQHTSSRPEDTAAREREAEAERREAQRREAARAAAQRREAQRQATQGVQQSIQGALANLGENLSAATQIDIPGPGGEAYANYSQAVQSIYYHEWSPPSGLREGPSVVAEVRVRRDGQILSSRIVERSGVAGLDRSVQDALDRVRLRGLPAFPEASRDLQRLFRITFVLDEKLSLG